MREQQRELAMKYLTLAALSALAACATVTPGPVDQRNSAFTQGNVQLNLQVGRTTKADVLDKFGSPNITTRDGAGQEVWSYQRMATVSQSTSSSSYWTILLTGQGKSADGFSQSSRSVTLIIKFDSHDVVSDFRSRTSDF
jgi:outer membrane protein assembly factor BamE (lipoprotein component of BamABCDE complex)